MGLGISFGNKYKDENIRLLDRIAELERRSVLTDVMEGKYPVGGITQTTSNKGDNCSPLSLSAVFAATEMISNSIANMPIELKSVDNNGQKIVDTNSYLSKVFDNGVMSKFMLVKCMFVDLLLYGNGFAYIERKNGRVTGLRYLECTDVNIFYNKLRNDLYYTCSYIQPGRIEPRDILHIYKNSGNGFQGIGILTFAARTLRLANYTENSALDYFGKGLNMTGMLHAKAPMTKVQAEQAVNSLQNTGSSVTENYIRFIPFDVDFQTLSSNAKDAALVENRLFNIQEVARYFGISPTLLQDLSHSNYNTVEAANISFLSNTLLPYIKLFEDEINRKLINNDKLYFDLDEREFLRMDGKTNAEYYSKLVTSGIITVNEAREALGYNKKEDCDDLIVAYTKIEDNTVGNKSSEETVENEETVNK